MLWKKKGGGGLMLINSEEGIKWTGAEREREKKKEIDTERQSDT